MNVYEIHEYIYFEFCFPPAYVFWGNNNVYISVTEEFQGLMQSCPLGHTTRDISRIDT